MIGGMIRVYSDDKDLIFRLDAVYTVFSMKNQATRDTKARKAIAAKQQNKRHKKLTSSNLWLLTCPSSLVPRSSADIPHHLPHNPLFPLFPQLSLFTIDLDTMAPSTPPFHPADLEAKILRLPTGKPRKAPNQQPLNECALMEIMQFSCDVVKHKKHKNGMVVCEPIQRVFRR